MPFAGSIADFGFTEVLLNNIPYEVVGYSPTPCSGTGAFYPPPGWYVSSCDQMMNGTHGAPSPTSPVSLIFCRPTVKINQPGVQQTVTPFEQIGGIPGFIAMLVIGVGLMGGYIYLASKNNKK